MQRRSPLYKNKIRGKEIIWIVFKVKKLGEISWEESRERKRRGQFTAWALGCSIVKRCFVLFCFVLNKKGGMIFFFLRRNDFFFLKKESIR